MRHPDNWVIEVQRVNEVVGRILDADGDKELGMEVYDNYMYKAKGITYPRNSSWRTYTTRGLGAYNAHLDDTTDDEDDGEDEEIEDSADWTQPVYDYDESNVEWTNQYDSDSPEEEEEDDDDDE